jgi:hypothetical protein
MRALGLLAASAGGYALFAIITIVGIDTGQLAIPGGDIVITFDPAGDALRAGLDPYAVPPFARSLFFAPPWAVIYAALSWMPPTVLHLITIAAGFTSLRYLARSWRGVGYCLWLPVIPFELASGNINLIIAATIVAAFRNRAEWLALGAYAKFSPVLALRPSMARRFLIGAAIGVAITIPWLWLWVSWIQHDVAAIAEMGRIHGPQVPIPAVMRFAVAALLVLLRRPWASAAAAAIAVPFFYWVSTVLLLAPIAVYLDGRPAARPESLAATPAEAATT